MKITYAEKSHDCDLAFDDLEDGHVYFDHEDDGPYLKTDAGLFWFGSGEQLANVEVYTYREAAAELVIHP